MELMPWLSPELNPVYVSEYVTLGDDPSARLVEGVRLVTETSPKRKLLEVRLGGEEGWRPASQVRRWKPRPAAKGESR